MAIASFAIGAAQTVVGFMGQQAQYKSQQQYYENNRQAANQAAVDRYTSQQNRALQEREAASQEKQNTQTKAMKARATAATAAGEGGVAGLSVDALMADYYAQQGRYERSIDNNYQMTADYLRSEMDATQAQATSRINSVQQGTPPSFASAAVSLFGNALNGLSTYNKIKKS